MKKIAFLMMILVTTLAYGGEVERYMEAYRQSRDASDATETAIVADVNVSRLCKELEPYYVDSADYVRYKAYELTYRKGLTARGKDRQLAVTALMKGVSDANSGVVGQCLRYLRRYKPDDFNEDARSVISKRVSKWRTSHYKELVLLAGSLGVGMAEMQQVMKNDKLNKSQRWNLSLALSRLGDKKMTNLCVSTAKKMPVGNNLVSYMVPDLIYTRQRPAIDFCLSLLQSDEPLCNSQNPNIDTKIPCAYPVIAQLAPIIRDFPVKLDASGDLATDDYEKTLKEVRAWVKANRNYVIE